MMHLRPDDPVWKGRALRLAELMRDCWTGRKRARAAAVQIHLFQRRPGG